MYTILKSKALLVYSSCRTKFLSVSTASRNTSIPVLSASITKSISVSYITNKTKSITSSSIVGASTSNITTPINNSNSSTSDYLSCNLKDYECKNQKLNTCYDAFSQCWSQ
ncbi:hypothetical protein U3516DRAFT_851839 [Neocallimastix sp. 'constans']